MITIRQPLRTRREAPGGLMFALPLVASLLASACSSTPNATGTAQAGNRGIVPVVTTAVPAPVASPPPAAAATTAAAPAATAAAAAPAAPPAAAPAAPALPPVMPFEEALSMAANNLFGKAALPEAGPLQGGKFPVVIDPLVDGATGAQSVATQNMEKRVRDLVGAQYPKYAIQPFTTGSLSRAPLLFIGTFTPVDKDGKNAGARDWYRICLALVDLHSGKIVSKGFARSKLDGVDITPTAFFQDSPAWAPDPAIDGYVRTCQGTKVGDPINPAYYDKIVAAALISDAMEAYNAGRFDEALDLYKGVARTGAGDQLRVYNGMYLSAWRLGRKDEASLAFNKIVEFGLAQKRLGVKFLFRPGSTLFLADQRVSGPYSTWLKQIANQSGRQTACLEIVGHTSRTGPEPLNERLSLMRAQYVKQRLETDSPVLVRRGSALGKGSRENLSGLGTDDARDALDRRVEFLVKDCPAT